MKLRLRHLLAYGIGDLGANLVFQPAAIFLLAYFTDVRGLPLGAIGALFLTARLWDGVSDPLMGWIAQRTRSPRGRFRPWLCWGAVPAAVSVACLFWFPGKSFNLAGAWASYLFFITAFTVINVPFGALTASLTTDHHDRSRLTAYRLFFGIGGAAGIGLLFPWMVERFGGGEKGHFLAACLAGAGAFAAFLIAYKGLPPDPWSGPRTTWSGQGRMLLQNGPFWMVTLAFFFGFSALSLFMALLPFVFNHVLSRPDLLGWGILAFQGATGLSLPGWFWVSRKVGKRNTVWLGTAGYVVGFAGFFFTRQFPLLWLALIGGGNGAAALGSWSMLADTVDYGEWKNGKRAEGPLFGIFGFFFKAGLGVGGALASWGLAWANYAAALPVEWHTIERIRWVSLAGPPALMALLAVVLAFYPISSASYHRMRKEIRARQAASG